MRLVVFSDVHGNLEALEIFLEALRNEHADNLFCLGDSVGYGPNPNECLELIRSLSNLSILMGNHEWATLSPHQARLRMNPIAYKAIEWTMLRLTEANFKYISHLPMSAECGSFCFYHASAHYPFEWEYVRPGDVTTVKLCFSHSTRRITCLGHTHQPALIGETGENLLPESLYLDETSYIDDGQSRFIINPGSIGQPRDSSHLPCYVVYDTDTGVIRWRRLLDYAPHLTAEKILNSDLPRELAYYLTGWP
ncbi:MAG: metallophosphatase family protein [Deltaproteobacteria bacterium]|nr:metallophosphatase family protein [Deltaproteobacteria bacterium]